MSEAIATVLRMLLECALKEALVPKMLRRGGDVYWRTSRGDMVRITDDPWLPRDWRAK